MKKTERWAVSLFVGLMFSWCALSRSLSAADGMQPQEGDVEVRDFTFQDGERLPLLRLHYTALGTAQRDASGKINNAVLLLHGTTGTGKSFLMPALADHLFQPGQPLDIQRYYVVLPDGIGAGGSTKPSDGMQSRFPHYGYMDQVEAQRAMLKGMGVEHLKLVFGISQGGMQTWLWGERFPDAMDALAPVACMPTQISGRNLLWREIVVRAILDDPEWRGGDYDPTRPPTQWAQIAAPLFAVMVSSPERLQEAGPDRAKTLGYYDQLAAQWRGRDAADTLYDVKSSADYDPAPEIGRIKAPMLAINFADDQVNPAQFGVTRETVTRLPLGQLTVLPGGYGHLGIFHAELWADQLGSFLAHLPRKETATK
jgi:homoserine O-acetyltransferase